MEVTEEASGDPSRISSPQQLAVALSLVRERAGLTVRDVHKRTGIAASTLGGYFSGRHRPPLGALEQILAVCGVTDPDQTEAWTSALLRVRRPDRRRARSVCPYRGLEPFQSEHRQWYFGRSQLVETVTRRLLESAAAGHPLVVVGPSGAGKSSLLAAGVVPGLADEHGMRALVITPGTEPLQEIDAQIANNVTDNVTDVLVVDQLEEVFAPDVSAASRAAFLTALNDLAARPPGAGRVAVVIGLRADFYAEALRLRELATALQWAQVLVEPMTPKELREVVVRPAEQAGVEIEDDLVDLLLEDLALGDDPSAGALPLLSHALMSTWRRSNGIRMTLADYRATGGVRGAIGRSAEDAIAQLGSDYEEPVRQMFLRLVHVAEDVVDTRRRVERAALLHIGHAAATAEALDRFVHHRLLVVDGTSVQIAHEALLVAWPRLRSWIDADRAGLAAHRRLAEAARQWLDHGEDPDALLRGARLHAASERFRQPAHAADLNDVERRFLVAGEEQETRRSVARKRQTRRLRRLLATATVLFLTASGLGAYAVHQRNSIAAERDAAVSRHLAVRSDTLRGKDPALAAQLAAAAYRIAPTTEARSSLFDSTAVPLPARLLGPGAVTQTLAVGGGLGVSATGALPTAQIWRLDSRGKPRLVGDTVGTTAPIQTIALQPGAGTLAAGSSDGRIVVMDLTDRTRPPRTVRAGGGNVLALSFTPDGRTVIAGTADGLHAWTMPDGGAPSEIPFPLPHGSAPVHAVAVSPDGRLLAAGGADGVTSLYTVDGSAMSPVAQLPGPGGKVFAAAFAPDGAALATAGGDRTVQLWDVVDPARPHARAVLAGPSNWLNAVAFTPDGSTIAGGSSDGHAWLWDVVTGEVRGRLPHPTPVTAAAFLDADTLVTGAADGTVRLWPVHGPLLTGFDDAVFALDFDASGGILAIGPGRQDNAAHLWNISAAGGPRPLGAVPNPSGEAPVSGSAALTPNGRILAVGRTDGSVRLWDVADPARPVAAGAPLVGSGALVEQLTISADGRLLAVSGDDNTVRLWDIAQPEATRPLATLTWAGSYVLASAFSSDGRLLAASSADTTTYLWDLAQPDRPELIASLTGPSSYAYSPAFSADDRLLAIGSADKTVRLWDVTDPHHPVQVGTPLTGPTNYVYSVAFSPSGAELAAASTDGTVWLWDLTDPRSPRVLATLTGPTEAAFSVAWSPDGRRLVAGSADRDVRIWQVDPVEAEATLCSRSGSPLTADEWARFEPSSQYDSPCR
ncbi:nSTAND1 domain-containing NTPase [Pseudonocardia sp. DLS-67]